VNPSAQLQVLR